MLNKDRFECEIVEKYAVISVEKNGWTKELNLVSYNGAVPKYDIRAWDPDHKKMGKGITLTREEMISLRDALNNLK